MSVNILREFFGWMTLINLGLFAWSAVMIVFCRGFIQRVHGKMFGLDEEAMSKALYYFLAFYKIVFIAGCLVPWLALTIITS